MNPSIAATLLVSLRRTRAAWPIVAAAGLTCVLATTLLAAGPIYANAVSVAGLHRVLADAPVEQANVQASLRVIPAEVAAADVAVTGAIEASCADVGDPDTRQGSPRRPEGGASGDDIIDNEDVGALEAWASPE